MTDAGRQPRSRQFHAGPDEPSLGSGEPHVHCIQWAGHGRAEDMHQGLLRVTLAGWTAARCVPGVEHVSGPLGTTKTCSVRSELKPAKVLLAGSKICGAPRGVGGARSSASLAKSGSATSTRMRSPAATLRQNEGEQVTFLWSVTTT
jgi:hypothetical protein